MPKRISKENLFKPAKSRSETKADITDRMARSIMSTEESRRKEKTARLRAQRLANEKA